MYTYVQVVPESNNKSLSRIELFINFLKGANMATIDEARAKIEDQEPKGEPVPAFAKEKSPSKMGRNITVASLVGAVVLAGLWGCSLLKGKAPASLDVASATPAPTPLLTPVPTPAPAVVAEAPAASAVATPAPVAATPGPVAATPAAPTPVVVATPSTAASAVVASAPATTLVVTCQLPAPAPAKAVVAHKPAAIKTVAAIQHQAGGVGVSGEATIPAPQVKNVLVTFGRRCRIFSQEGALLAFRYVKDEQSCSDFEANYRASVADPDATKSVKVFSDK